MFRTILALALSFLMTTSSLAQAPSSDQLNQPHVEPPPTPAHKEAPLPPAPPLPPVGQDMHADLMRMRALLAQMRNNLAFVSNTQSPLKHQFELEADMWQILISDLERHLNVQPASNPNNPSPPPSR